MDDRPSAQLPWAPRAYRPSGRFSIFGLRWLGLGGAVGWAVGAALATALELAGGLVWVGFGLVGECHGGLAVAALAAWLVGPLVAAFALGMGVRIGVRRGRCRSSWAAAAVAVVLAVPAAIAAGWAHERWGEGLTAVTPIASWVGGLLAGWARVSTVPVAAFATFGAASDDPFCEACGTYAERGQLRRPAAEAPQVVDALATPAPVGPDDPTLDERHAVTVTWRSCPCGALNLLEAHAPHEVGKGPVRCVHSALVSREHRDVVLRVTSR